jgi:prepilin-type N-terminal cleavage/methylation domain-containing protein
MELKTSNQNGFTLVEVMIVVGIQAVVALGTITFIQSQLQATNFVEYKTKQIGLRLNLTGQFLSDPNNCKCLFAGSAPFPAAGTSSLAVASPNAIGVYSFLTPGDCSTASIIDPYVTAAGVDGVKLTDVSVKDIQRVSTGTYRATLNVTTSSAKSVSGPSSLVLRIPVTVNATPVSASQVQFGSCSFSGSAAPSGMDYTPTTRGPAVFRSLSLSHSGGSGISAGSPSVGLSQLGNYDCGPVVTVTLSDAALSDSSKAALLNFYSGDNQTDSPAVRLFDMSNRLVGLVGQVGRDGDGKSFGMGGEVLVPLTSRRFRIQGCRRDHNLNIVYAVKAVLN